MKTVNCTHTKNTFFNEKKATRIRITVIQICISRSYHRNFFYLSWSFKKVKKRFNTCLLPVNADPSFLSSLQYRYGLP
jgi:hypothetical protein